MSTKTASRIDRLMARINSAYNVEAAFDPTYKPNALTVFNKRYPRKDEQGEPTESPREVHWRITLNVASATVLYQSGAAWQEGDPEPEVIDAAAIPFPFRTIVRQYNWLNGNGHKLKPFWDVVENGLDAWLSQASKYYEMTSRLIFIPNSPTWTGAGTPLGQLAACFVLPIEDALVDGYANIMKTLRDAVAIQKTGGGNGFSFGRLRPAGWVVKTSMGQATGVVGFLRMYDAVFDEIRQGGSRRGANMGVCPVWHPDVLYFIRAKVEEGVIPNFNISVGVTDRFLAAVENDEPWQFRFPGPDGPIVEVEWNGDRVKSVPARELWDFITNSAWRKGDPGLLFIDEANRYNPCPSRYTLESTNPCGEQWLGPYENCCLGSIAVQHFVQDDGSFDWESFDYYHALATEFLDDVVDANAYVPSVPELEYSAQNGRRIGLGQMGLADAMVKVRNPQTGSVGVRYGSEDGLDFASQLAERMRYISMQVSVKRARERGAFPWIGGSIYDPELLRAHGAGATVEATMEDGQTPCVINLWHQPKPLVEHQLDFGRPACDWDAVTTGITENGIRNSAQTTFAPTGTIASTAGCEGYGCECMFALTYERTMMQEGEDIKLPYASDLFRAALERAGLDELAILTISAAVQANKGSCQGIDLVPEAIRRAFVVAADLTPTEHVMAQAVLQAFVDNSISKTINFRNEATVEEVDAAYRLAAKTGCKGITIYRQGSRDREVLAVKTVEAPETGTIEVVDEDHWPIIRPLPIPPEAEEEGMESRTYTVRTPFGKMRATFTHLAGRPDRIFDAEVKIGRGGSDVNAFTEAVGRAVSVAFRAGVDPLEVADQLIGIGGATREETLRPDKSLSLPDAFGKLIRRHVERRKTGYVVATPVATVEAASVILGKEAVVDGYVPDKTGLCPECHQANLVRGQGCTKCMTPDCGYDKCG